MDEVTSKIINNHNILWLGLRAGRLAGGRAVPGRPRQPRDHPSATMLLGETAHFLLAVLGVNSWFFLDVLFVYHIRDCFPPGKWEKLDFADGFCC